MNEHTIRSAIAAAATTRYMLLAAALLCGWCVTTVTAAGCDNNSPCNGNKFQNTGNCGGVTTAPLCCPSYATKTQSCFPFYPDGKLPDGSTSTLLPFGPGTGDVATFKGVSGATAAGGCDDCFWQWSLAAAGIGGQPLTLPFYGRTYQSLYINNNGLLSFTQGVSSWNGLTMPTSCCGPLIAVYWADVDTRVSPSGVVYHRVVNDAPTLTNLTITTKSCFNTVKNFNAQYALVVSWDAVGVYNQVNTLLNTFQVVITSDGAQSYILFNFGWKAQQWAKGSASTTAFPQVGFDAGDGVNYFNAVGTQTAQMLTLWSLSNAQPNVPGRQCFKIDAASIGSPIISSTNANLTNLVPNGFAISPAYSFFVNQYTIGVTNGFALRWTPTQLDPDQVTTVQGVITGSGVMSPAITITSQTTITVITTADDGVTQRTIQILVSIVPSPDAKLIALAVQGQTFTQGAFDSSGNTYAYSLTIPSSIATVTFTGTTSGDSATVRMQQYGPFGNTFSLPGIATVVGTTAYPFNCTAENGVNSLVYTITITVTASTDSTLASITNNLGYTVTVVNPTTYSINVLTTDGALSVTATATFNKAMVQIAGDGYVTAARTDTVVLSNFGVTPVTIQVRSESGAVSSYTLNINRPFSSNADLTALSAQTNLAYGITLSPVFASGTVAYFGSVASWTAGVMLSATLSDASYASMTVLGVSLGSGSTTAVLTLNTDGVNGANTVFSVRVSAQDSSIKVYNVTIFKPPMSVITALPPTATGACASSSYEINRNEYQTIRVSSTAGGEVLQVTGTSNVTAGAPQIWLRLNAVPNVGGVLGTDFASASSPITSIDNSSSATVLWSTPSVSYYVTFTPSTASAPVKAFRITLSVCNYLSTNISLFGSIASSTIVRNGWNFFATYPTPTQTVAGVLFQMASTVPLPVPYDDPYFYTYAKTSLNPPYPTPADAPTFFGAVVTATNPITGSGPQSKYTATALAPTAGSSRVLFAVYAKHAGVTTTLPTYTITVNATIPPPSIVLAQPLTGPTGGGTIVTIQGTNFEPLTSVPCTNGFATIGGVLCTALNYNSARDMECTVPAGQGQNLPIVVTLYGFATPTFALTYSYNPPTINGGGVTWSNAPTSGNGTVTIQGTNFGTSATATIDGLPCIPVSTIPQTQIICRAPAGQGSVVVAVSAGGQAGSNTGTYTYDAPVLLTSVCTNAATTGGNPLTINGRNFGTSNAAVVVTVGGLACPLLAWNHTAIVCSTPAGAGASQTITVSVNSLFPSYPPSVAQSLTYTAPVLSSITPSPVPVTTATLTLRGSGFSTPAFAMSISLLGGSCTNIQNRNDTYLTCTPPARSIGVPALPFVTVAGQPSNSLPGFGYATPVLYSLSPLVVSPNGGDYVLVSGLNLLGVDQSISLAGVSLGGGGAVLISKNDTALLWSTPALSGGGLGYNLAVQYFVGGLSSNLLSLNYSRPVFTSISWTGSPSTQPCTDGLCTATIVGNNFGTSQAAVGGSITLSTGQSCASTSWTNALISCTYPAGTGSHTLRITAGGQSTASIPVTYRAPTISSLTPAAGVSTAGGDILQIDGANFGPSQPVGATVTIVLKSAITVSCSPISSWTNYQIKCVTPIGNGTALPLTVTVTGQTGSIATFRYANPTITGVTAAGNSFPTAGAVPITIAGTSLDGYGSVTVNSVNCPVVSWSQSSVVCTLPSGGGTPRQVVLTTYNSLPSNSYPISYDVPSISSTIPTTITQIGQVITLVGSNFGNIIGSTSVAVTGVSGSNTISFSNHTHLVFTLGGTPTTQTVSITVTYQSQSSAAYGPVSVAAPVLSLLSPANGPTGPTGSYNLTITGSGFGDGVSRATSVSVGSASCTPILEVKNFNRLICRMPAGVDSQLVQLVVGTQSSNSLPFQYDAPRVVAVAPNSNLPTGGGTIAITIMGTSFGTGTPTVTVGTSSCTPILTSNHTVITCTLPAGLGSNIPVAVRASSQPSNTDVTVSYIGPAISGLNPTLGATAGGSNLVITGTNFGPGGSSAGSVTVGGVDCPVTLASYSPTSITCTLPAGAGTGLFVQVTVNGATSNNYPFGYINPVIGAVTPQSAAVTSGSFVVIITGSNFGPASLPGSVSVNGTDFCSIQPNGWTSNSITCLMPAGAGTVSIAVTTGVTPAATGSPASQTSATSMFTYAAPTISGLTPPNGPTVGGTTVTIAGTNFFVRPSGVTVTFGGFPCVVGSVSDLAIQCTTPGGMGGVAAVSVSVYGQPASNTFTYDPAVVTSIQYSSGATNALLGSQPAAPLLVVGSNFGIAAASVGIKINGINCGSVTVHNHTAVMCSSIPPGTGTALPVQVAINGAAYTAINSLFSYSAPVLSSISGGCTNSGSTVVDCPVSGGVNITLNGAYFGPIGSSVSVSVNGVAGACKFPDYRAIPDGNRIVCTIPAGTSFNIPVVITVGGQSSAPLYIAYAGPRLTTGSLTVPGSPAYGTGTVLLPNINGTQIVHFAGTFLSPWFNALPYPPDLQFGTAGSASKEYTCTRLTYSNTFVECQLPAIAVGTGLTFIYSDGVQLSPESVDTISFPAPVWVGGSIQNPAGSPGTSLPGSSSQGEFIQFLARNVGSDASKLTVYYDVPGGSFNLPSQQCTTVSIVTPFSSSTGTTKVQCRTQSGSGGPYVFVITALNQASAPSTDTYSYPASPLVFKLIGGANSGCNNTAAGNNTYNCYTAPVNGVLTIVGANFGTVISQNNVLLGSNSCPVQSASANQLTCLIPGGTGQNVAVTVFSNNLVSQPAPLFSYAKPVISTVTGCTDQPDGSTIGCSRGGTTKITITGKFFGPSGAFVFVGANQCTFPVTVSDSQVTCFIAAGTNTNVAVLLLQNSGTVSSNTGVLSYTPCPIRTYQANSTDYACTPTPAGYYADTTGLLAPKPCTPGSWSAASASGCSQCLAGEYQPSPSALACIKCKEGTFSDIPGAAGCTNCPLLSYANGAGNIACSPCPAGTQASGTVGNRTIACTNCTSGFYSSTPASNCQQCPPGLYNPGSGLTACLTCDAGTYQPAQGGGSCTAADIGFVVSTPGQVAQTPCSSGSFSNVTGSSVCLSCVAGQWTPKQQTACSLCDVGSYIGVTGAADCLACPRGTFADLKGSTACTSCSLGKVAGNIGLTLCTNCTAGSIAGATGLDSCSPCASGSWSGSGYSACSLCQIGEYQPSSSATACIACGIGAGGLGQVNPSTGQQSCVPCAAGSYQDQTGKAACLPCAAGSFAPSSHASTCTACGLGTFSTSNQAGCTDCAAGKYANVSASVCSTCIAGTFSPTKASTCTDCVLGQYAPQPNSVTCVLCPVGSYANVTGSSVCSVCLEGTQQPSTGASSCSLCPAGSISSATGQVACTPCSIGSFSDSMGASVCGICKAGTYAPGPSQTACTNCSKGEQNGAPGQGSCGPCSVGSYADHVATLTCSGCPPGYAAASTGLTVCSICTAGSFSIGFGNRECTSCGVGSFQNLPGQTYCSQCNPGSVQPLPGQGSCSFCLPGQIQASPGQAVCTDCPVGQFSKFQNQTVCSLCKAGEYAPSSGLSVCGTCGVGSVSTGVGAGGCDACTIGHYQNATASLTICFTCQAGSFQPNPGQTGCTPCLTGSAQPVPGQSGCAQCPDGSYADVGGLDNCKPCPAGQFCPFGSVNPQPCALGSITTGPSQSSCLLCPSGEFSNTSLATACVACTAGKFSVAGFSTGATVCSSCGVGTISFTDRSVGCDACPSGSYAASTGQSRCQTCVRGTYQLLPGRTLCNLADPGYYVPSVGAGVETLCPSGTYSVGTNNTACSQCQPGTVQNPVTPATVCSDCLKGQYMPSVAQAVCLECDSGSFTNTTGLSSCYKCPIGKFSQTDSSGTGQSSCTDCDLGTFAATVGSVTCSPCPARTYADVHGLGECTVCPKGRAFSGTGATACADCAAGSFANNENSLTCTPCPTGQFQSAPRSSACSLCSAGSFANTTGMSACLGCLPGTSAFVPGAVSCADCPVGYFSAIIAQPNCTACPVGTAQPDTGRDFCVPCANGTANAAVGQQICPPCKAGQYAEVPNLAECRNCPSGSYTKSTGYSACTQCEAGRSNPQFAQTTCVDCTFGTYVNSTGSVKAGCDPCELGKFQSRTAQSTCNFCANGTAIGVTGQSACANCLAGQYADSTGQTACVLCPLGYAQPLNTQSSCNICRAGSSAPLPGSGACTDCVRGSITTANGTATCSLCFEGEYQDQGGQSECKQCGYGTFQEAKRGTSCVDCETGKFANITGSTACVVCDMGKFASTQKQSACTLCIAGEYNAQANQQSCTRCPVGRFTDIPGQTDCFDCLPGSYQDVIGQSSCAFCPNGTANPSSAQLVCARCAQGRYQPEPGNTTCIECPVGRAQSGIGATACTECAFGTFMASTGQLQCSDCLVGTYANRTGLSECDDCYYGTYQIQTGKSVCDNCPLGKHSNNLGNTFCADCAAGTYTAQNRTIDCAPCAPGTSQNAPGQTSCAPCVIGTFQFQPSQTACSQCAPSTFGNSSGLAQCFDCPTGRFEAGFSSTACSLCAVGSYQSNPGQTSCAQCPIGTATPLNGSTDCTPCDKGSFQLLPGKTKCDPCPAGSDTDVTGQSICAGCVPGSFGNGTGTSYCFSCERGRYQDNYAKTSCMPCAKGYFAQNSRQTACLLCGAGRYGTLNGTTVCAQCDAGTFNSGLGKSVCNICPIGTFAPSGGATVCLSCQSGSFGNRTGLSECFSCGFGTYQPSAGQVNCSYCPVGSYQVQTGQAVCTSCPLGQFGNSTGAQTCTLCPIGQFASSTGSTVCETCGEGKYSDRKGQPACTLCFGGTYTSLNGTTECSQCDAGKFQLIRGQTACTNCTGGKFSGLPGATACSQCAPGAFNVVPGRTACSPCTIGTFSVVYGRNSCDDCPLGYFGTAPGQSSCQQCAPGSYGNATGIQICAACPLGRAQLSFGQTACDDCLAGTYADQPGSSICSACSAGSFSVLNGTTSCGLCPNSTFNPIPGQTVCQACQIGKAASTPGALQCADCAPGSFGNATGQSVCRACNYGTFQSGYAATACVDCPVSRYQDQTGQTACLLCQTGKFGVANASQSCVDCGPGTVQPNTGSTFCVACTVGKANRLFGQSQCAACSIGTFGNTTGAVNCYECPKATYQPNTGQSNCTDCPLGEFNELTGVPSCTPCPAGQFQNKSASTFCYGCGPGTAQPSVGGTACLLCAAGTFNQNPSAQLCSPCSAGTYVGTVGATICVECDYGTAQDAFGRSSCLNCTQGRYANVPGKTACSLCSAGSTQLLEGATDCDSCGLGKYAPLSGSTSCFLCETGKATSAPGSSDCALCPPGSTTPFPGAWNCTACAIGTAQRLSGQNNCSLCDPGTYSASTGLQQCTSCDFGKFANVSGLTVCGICGPGRFQDQQGGSICKACPTGTFSTQPQASTCIECDPGSHASVAGATACVGCDPGTASKLPGRTDCEPCPAGSYTLDAGNKVCRACDVGTFVATNGSTQVCGACPTGTYQPNTGASFCNPCGMGTYNPSSRQAECLSCKAGDFTNKTGVDACDPCEPGSSQPNTGSSACVACSAGKAAFAPGLPDCLVCSAGKVTTRKGQTVCSDCPAGTQQPLSGQQECTPCATQRYSNAPGEPLCALCEAGKYGNRTGQQSCNPCPAGYYQDRYGQVNCLPCPPGFSTNQATGLPACQFCPDGQANANTGSPSCAVCIQTAVPSFNRQKCDCIAGYYQPSYVPNSNNFICDECPDGADCQENGRSWTNLPALSGWWRPTNVSLHFYRCLLPQYCTGGEAVSTQMSERSGSPCAANREGIMCSHCIAGYESAAVGAGCTPCPDSTATSSSAVLLGILFLAVLIAQFWYILKSGDGMMKRVLLDDRAREAEADQIPVDRDIFGEEKDKADDGDVPSKKAPADGAGDLSESDVDSQKKVDPAQGKEDSVDSSSDEDDAETIARNEADGITPEMARAAKEEKRKRKAQYRAAAKATSNRVMSTGPEPPKPDFTYKLKIFLGFLQIVTNLGTGLQIQWPARFKEFVQAFEIANFQNIVNQATSVECVASYSYYVQYVVIVLSPIAVTLVVFLFYLFPRYVGIGPCCRFESPAAQQRSKMRFWRLALYVIFLIYPGVSSTVLRHYICIPIDGTDYLFADLRVECYTQTWNLFALVSIILVLLYPIGVPLFFFSLLRVNHKHLNDGRTKLQLGFLYAGYHLKCWWFEMIDMTHKLIVTSLLALFPSEAQLPVGMVVVTAYAACLLLLHPYIRTEDDQLHLFCQTEVFLLLCVGYVFYSLPANDSYSDFDDTVISIALLAVCVVFMGLFLWYAIVTIYKMGKSYLRNRQKQKEKQAEGGADGAAGAAASAAPSKPGTAAAAAAAAKKPAADDAESSGSESSESDGKADGARAAAGDAPASPEPNANANADADADAAPAADGGGSRPGTAGGAAAIDTTTPRNADGGSGGGAGADVPATPMAQPVSP